MTRALITQKGKEQIVVLCDGYPTHIIPLLFAGNDIMKSYRAEPRQDKAGYKIALNQFDYIYFIKKQTGDQIQAVMVYKKVSYKLGKFKFMGSYTL